MFDTKGRVNAALALVLLAAAALACSSLKNLGKNPLDEANRLVREANNDLDQIDDIWESADKKRSDLSQADKDNKPDEVKRILGDLINDIDKGLKLGEDAADKFDQASKLDVDAVYKDYLSNKATAARKGVDSFKARREAFIILRDNYQTSGLPEDKNKDFRAKIDDSNKLWQESVDANKKAKDIQRKNPDKFK
jgi:hypothetical protein